MRFFPRICKNMTISVEELHVVRVACLIICSREYLWQNNLYWLSKLVLGMRFCIACFSLRIYLPLWKRCILKSPSKNISLSRLMSSNLDNEIFVMRMTLLVILLVSMMVYIYSPGKKVLLYIFKNSSMRRCKFV